MDTAYCSHWVMHVRGDGRAVLRKLQRLAGAQAQDVRLMRTSDVQEQSSRMIKASTLEPCPGQAGRYRQQLISEKILARVNIQTVDFLMPHAPGDWPALCAAMLDMAARIAPQWQLLLHGKEGMSAHTGQAFNWHGLSQVQTLCWSLRQDQRYTRSILPL